jgi:hypothetical protein
MLQICRGAEEVQARLLQHLADVVLLGCVKYMGLGTFIVIIKELKAHVFNAKGKREILYGYWRSLPSNLLGNLSVHLL